jgi:hypothetical protein
MSEDQAETTIDMSVPLRPTMPKPLGLPFLS